MCCIHIYLRCEVGPAKYPPFAINKTRTSSTKRRLKAFMAFSRLLCRGEVATELLRPSGVNICTLVLVSVFVLLY